MSDTEKVPYIKRLENQRDALLKCAKSAERYLLAMKKLHTTNYDRPAAGRDADRALAELEKDIETVKGQMGGSYA